jgi:hypothetical protein
LNSERYGGMGARANRAIDEFEKLYYFEICGVFIRSINDGVGM